MNIRDRFVSNRTAPPWSCSCWVWCNFVSHVNISNKQIDFTYGLDVSTSSRCAISVPIADVMATDVTNHQTQRLPLHFYSQHHCVIYFIDSGYKYAQRWLTANFQCCHQLRYHVLRTCMPRSLPPQLQFTTFLHVRSLSRLYQLSALHLTMTNLSTKHSR